MNLLVEFVCGDRGEVTMKDIQRTVARCQTCQLTRAIKHVVVLEWYSKCYDCRHKRYWGDNEALAKDAANRHWRQNNSHRVTYAKGRRPHSAEAQEKLMNQLGISCG